MKMQYSIVKASSLSKLTERVQSKIGEGWIPQGGVCVDNASFPVFTQAVILKAE